MFLCALVLAVSLCFTGCAPVNPRDQFKNTMNSMLEKDVDKIGPFEFGYKENLIATDRRLDGNIDNTYVYKNQTGGNCLYVFEVDSKTRKVLRWRIEGSDKPCFGAP